MDRLSGNVLYMGLSQLIMVVVSFGLGIYIARALGADQYGRYNLVMAFPVPFVTLLGFGIGPVLIREIARWRHSTSRTLVDGIALTGVFGLLALMIMVAAALITDYESDLLVLIVIAGCTIAVGQLSEIFRMAFQGLEQMHLDTLTRFVGRLIILILIAVSIYARFGLLGVLVAMLLASLVELAYCFALARRQIPTRWPRPSLATGSNLIRRGLPFAIYGVMAFAYISLVKIILSFLGGDTEVAMFSAAFNAIAPFLLLAAIVNRALVPTFARLHKSPKDAINPLLNAEMRYLVVASVPLSIFLFGFVGRLLTLLFGDAFNAAVIPARIIASALPLMVVSVALSGALGALGREQKLAVATGGSSIVGLSLCVLFSSYLGATGAALAVGVKELIFVIVLLTTIASHAGWPSRAIFYGPLLAFGVIVVGLVFALSAETTSLIAFVGFAFVVVFTKVITKKDLQLFTGMVTRMRMGQATRT